MNPDRHDPLEGADIGDTVYISETETLHGINFAPHWPYGRDRDGTVDITDVELVETDGPESYNNIRVTWEGETTKHLPVNWDYCREPLTKEEKQKAALRKWGARARKAVAFTLPFALATLLLPYTTTAVNNAFPANTVTVTWTDVLPVFAVIGILALAIQYAPRRLGDGRRSR